MTSVFGLSAKTSASTINYLKRCSPGSTETWEKLILHTLKQPLLAWAEFEAPA